MKPRCTIECAKDIRRLEAEKSALLFKIVEICADRDEWKTQHENLLAIYRAELSRKAMS